MENTLDAVCVALTQDGIRQRELRLCGVGDKRLPTNPLDAIGHGAFAAGEARNAGADLLCHPLCTCSRASPPANIMRLTRALLCPRKAEQPCDPLGFEHVVHRLQE